MTGKSFFKFADVEVREREFSLAKAGEALPVEPKAFRVLLILLRNPQKLLPKEELLNAVWGDTAVSENSLARSIALLRRLLGDEARTPRFIETVLGVLAFVHFREKPPLRQRVRFQINSPQGYLDDFKLSPDGSILAFATMERSTGFTLWIRSLDSLDARPLTHFEGLNMFLAWSPDGENIAFLAGKKLYRIPRSGGPATLLAEVPEWGRAGVWLDDGEILFATHSHREGPLASLDGGWRLAYLETRR